MTSLLSLFPLLLFTFFTPSSSQYICPPPESIAPCSCQLQPTSTLLCVDGSTTNEHIKNAISVLRSTNNASNPEDWLTIGTFYLYTTNLETFELAPFARMNIQHFYVWNNHFPLIVGGTNSSEEDIEPFRFSVEDLGLDVTPINNSMVATFLKFLHPQNLTQLHVTQNNLGGGDQGELIEGLSKFEYLTQLHFSTNGITTLVGGPFRGQGRLEHLYLANNQLSEIGVDGLVFDQVEGMENTLLTIYMMGNQLNDSSFDSDNGLHRLNRPVSIYLDWNKFEYISRENFELFLQANVGNRISLRDNSEIICDDRMTWLVDERDEYEGRVRCVDCSNTETDVFGGRKCN